MRRQVRLIKCPGLSACVPGRNAARRANAEPGSRSRDGALPCPCQRTRSRIYVRRCASNFVRERNEENCGLISATCGHSAAFWALRRPGVVSLAAAFHNSSREVGGGRIMRQPGQVRKEAALTILRRVVRQPPFIRSRALFGSQAMRHPSRPGAARQIKMAARPAAGRLAPSPFGRYGIQDHGQEKDHRH